MHFPSIMPPMHVRVPGSTSNLGHGFDCLGMALSVYNDLWITPCDQPPEHGDAGLNRLCGSVRELCQQVMGCPLPAAAVHIRGDVPIARGLGSSATIIIALAAFYQQLQRGSIDRQALVHLGYGIEGHPDNVAAAALGGCTIAAPVGDSLRCLRLDVPEQLRAVLTIPSYQVRTADARSALPDQLSREEAVRGWQRTALITAALASGESEQLRACFSQSWHEQYRQALNPQLTQVREIADDHGAIGTFLSGSGSTILSLCHVDRSQAVRQALVDGMGDGVEVRICQGDNQGVQLCNPDPAQGAPA